MRVVIQRVTSAHVDVDNTVVGSIEHGLAVLVGITHTDTKAHVEWITEKLFALRVFADSDGKMNLSLADIGGGLLLISQFTLYGEMRKGTRPSFVQASRPDHAEPLFSELVRSAHARAQTCANHVHVASGVFGAAMKVHIVNDGPVTIILDR